MTRVAIYIKGDKINQKDIGDKIGYASGRFREANKRYARQTNVWSIVIEENDISLSKCIKMLDDRIGTGMKNIKYVDNVEELFIDILFTIVDNDPDGGRVEWEISKEDLDILNKFGLPLQFSVIFLRN